ncbi:MAG: TetR/AcrR family transcriptional regulator [Pseudoxanthomonas sp.]|nr:TetR/AcrR family transcriptional regulator [Pseudoxanthomonas sp.]
MNDPKIAAGASRRPGPKPSPALRAAMLQAAVSLFSERGIEAATTREIASQAGTTERTLFKHFGSKEQLVSAVLNEVVIDSMRTMRFARIMDETMFSPAEFMDWHRGFLLERIAGAEASPDNYRILFRELLRDTELAQRFSNAWQQRVFVPLSGHLARMQAAGYVSMQNSPGALAALFYSLNIGYLLTRFALRAGSDWNSTSDVDSTVRLFASTCGWEAAAGS